MGICGSKQKKRLYSENNYGYTPPPPPTPANSPVIPIKTLFTNTRHCNLPVTGEFIVYDPRTDSKLHTISGINNISNKNFWLGINRNMLGINRDMSDMS